MLPLARGAGTLLVLAAALAACSGLAVPNPLAPPAAAVVDGETITMEAYQARLKVSQARDPYAGMPEAVPSPASRQRLQDFTIEQLIRETIIEQAARRRGIRISDQAVSKRIAQLAENATFTSAIARNGFTAQSFRDYERALLTEVALLQAMAKQRADSASKALESGEPWNSVVGKWNDDPGTTARHGEVGWVKSSDLPERELSAAVETLPDGARTGVIRTDRGYVIAMVLGHRADQIHLAAILVLAPAIDMFSPQGTPAWFTSFLDEQEAALRRDGKLTINVGSHTGS